MKINQLKFKLQNYMNKSNNAWKSKFKLTNYYNYNKTNSNNINSNNNFNKSLAQSFFKKNNL